MDEGALLLEGPSLESKQSAHCMNLLDLHFINENTSFSTKGMLQLQ